MKRRVKLLVAGRVQGVYFRAFTQKEAQRRGIVGSVQNLSDGRVEIIAEADEETLQPFIAWCHKGPITARVDSVEMLEWDSGEALATFAIIR